MPNKITLIYDRVTKAVTTFNGGTIPAPMQPSGAVEVFQGDRLLVNLRVVETLSPGAAQTAVDLTSPSNPTAVRIGVRDARSESADLLTFVDTYNEGYEATNENLSTGRITFALSFDTAAIDSALAAVTADHIVGHADFTELRTLVGTQFPTTYFGLTIKIYKQVEGGDVETGGGTAQAGGTSTITLASGASATDDIYNGFYILISGGTGAGQERTISDYVGSTKVATVSVAWGTQPDATSVYQIRASRFSTTVLTDAEVVARTPEVQTFSGSGTIVGANGIGTVYVSGSPTLTLPAASGYSRMGFIVINTDGGTTTINRAGSDTINSAATSYSVVGDNPAYILRDTSSHWQARQPISGIADPGGNGILARTALNTVSARTITGPAAGISVANGDGVSGNPTLSLANDLSALEALASTGIAVRTASDTWVQRSIAGTSPVQVTNGDGVSGNPTIDVNDLVGDSGAGGTAGLAPAPGTGDAAAGKFLKADATWAVPAGGGDVTGPGSSTDNAVARFDGTGGDTLQNSGVIVDDSNNVSGVTSLTASGDLVLAERADHAGTPGAGYGYLWVKNTTPSTIVFTDDAGTDTTLGSGGGDSTWTTVDGGSYTATPSDTNTLAMSDTSGVALGRALRYTIGGTAYYGQIVALVANTSIDVIGAPLSGDVTLLEIGAAAQVQKMSVYIPGLYGDGTDTDLIASDLFVPTLTWDGPAARLVGFWPEHRTDDGTSQPRVNVEIGGSAVSTANTNAGPSVSTTRASTGVAINTTNYVVAFGDAIELPCNTAGGDGDAADLAVDLIFVLE